MTMTLSQLKAFMIERKRVSLDEIAIHFGSDPSAVRPMLDTWMAKGRVEKLDLQGGCGKAGASCSCSAKPSEIFEWVGPQAMGERIG